MEQPVTFEGHLRDYTTRPRWEVLLAVAVGITIVTVLAVTQINRAPTNSSEVAYNGMQLTPPRELPALQLDRADGGRWSNDELDGRLSLFFFGYTHCPDVCPMTLTRATQIRDALGDRGADVAFYFVTVDPERDTPERLANYVAAFDPAIVGLTGSTGELSAAHEAFGVQAQKQQISGATNYAVDHTATSYLVDRQGRISMMYTHDAATAEMVEDLQRILTSR